MSDELSPLQSALALATWYALIALGIFCIYTAAVMLADGATLSMTGSCAGQGLENVTVEADHLVAAINQTANGTGWQITAWGVA